jgi:hypothetical protein
MGKKLKILKDTSNLIINSLNELNSNFQEQLKKIKIEYNKNIIDEKIKLLVSICNDNNLNFNEVKNKYLNNKEMELLCDTINIEETQIQDDLLDKIEIDGNIYYYEVKENGYIYNTKSEKIGVFKNNEFIFD